MIALFAYNFVTFIHLIVYTKGANLQPFVSEATSLASTCLHDDQVYTLHKKYAVVATSFNSHFQGDSRRVVAYMRKCVLKNVGSSLLMRSDTRVAN